MKKLNTLQQLLPILREAGNKECLVAMQPDGIVHHSCAEIATAAEQLARGLVQAGLQPGEYVPILASNRVDWVIVALAILEAGGAVSPLDTQIQTSALERIVADSEARFIFTTTEYVNRLRRFDPQDQIRLILFDVEPDDDRGWRTLLSDDPSIALPRVEPGDPAALFYTSGTTGLPKGVSLTHHNIAFQINAVHAVRLLRDEDRILLPLPMYHVYPFTVGMLIPLSATTPIILPQALTGPQLIRALVEGEVSIIIGIPRVYRAVYNGIEAQIAARGRVALKAFQATLQQCIRLRQRQGWEVGKRLFAPIRNRFGPKVRLLTSGGSALSPDLAWKLEGLGWNVAIGYGLTETSPMLTMNLPPPAGLPNLSSVGPALPGIDLRLDLTIKPEDNVAAMNGNMPQEGEILARGISVFTGYRNLPEQTAEAFTDNGWFRTGDLGYFDDKGYLYISGRASTLIVTEGGKNIQPEPVEDIYHQHQFIREVGILQDDENQLVAVVVPEIDEINWHRNGDVERAIREAIDDRLQVVPSYQRITDYAIAEVPLGRTNLGKIQRHKLSENYRQIKQGTLETQPEHAGPIAIEDLSEKDQMLLADPVVRKVWDWVSERYPDKRLTPDTSPQLDLGIDSLEWLTLSLELSDRFSVELSDEAMGRINLVRELLQEVQAAATNRQSGSGLSLANPDDLLTDDQKKWLTPRWSAVELLGMLIYFPLRVLARLYFRLRVYGVESIPTHSNFVLAPNHTSFLDAPVVAGVLPYKLMRQIYWAAAANMLFHNPLVRIISRIFQAIPIEHQRSGAGFKNLALGAAVLKQNKSLVWFPEGNVAPTAGLLPFQEGLGLMLEAYPTPVVPVYIEGAREALPRGNWLPHPKPITITFGPPCDPMELAEQGEGEHRSARIVNALRDQVVDLSETPDAQKVKKSSQNLAFTAVIEAAIMAIIVAVTWFFTRRKK